MLMQMNWQIDQTSSEAMMCHLPAIVMKTRQQLWKQALSLGMLVKICKVIEVLVEDTLILVHSEHLVGL